MTVSDDFNVMDLLKVAEVIQENIIWNEGSLSEYRELSSAVQFEATKYIIDIIRKPYMGKDLENKNGLNLYGCKKIYFDNTIRRIIYEEYEGKIKILALGLRNDCEVYKNAFLRRNTVEVI